MGRDFYVNHDPAEQKRKRTDSLTVAIISLLALLLVIGILVALWVRGQNQSSTEAAGRYEAAMEDEDYEAVLDLHQEAHEGSLDRTQTEANRERWTDILLTIERDVERRTEGITDGLLESDEPELAEEDLVYLSGMGSLTASQLDQFMIELGQSLLLGDVEPAQARRIYTQLRQVPQVEEASGRFISNISDIQTAAPVYQEVLQLQEAGAYTQATSRLQELIDSGELEEGGFAYTQMSQALQQSRDELRPRAIDEVRTLVENGRFISAQNRVEELQQLYPGDSELNGILEEIKQYIPEDLVLYNGTIEHIVLKPLIVNTTRAFTESEVSFATDQSMLTTTEFQRILQQLYDRDYVLIDYTSLLNSNGEETDVYLPQGKRPLILSLDDMTYTAPRAQLSGTCSQLVLDDNGNVIGQYIGPDGVLTGDRLASAIGIVDSFVEANPDFSFDGAKGIIAVSGNQGVFGYLLNDNQLNNWNTQASLFGLQRKAAPDYTAERETLTQLAKHLRETGWSFACYSYSGGMVSDMSQETLMADTVQWRTEIGAVVGDTSIYFYPSGAILSGDDQRKAWLIGEGFHFFGGQGPQAYANIEPGYYYMDRLYFGGYALREGLVTRMVDPQSIYDEERVVSFAGDAPDQP